MAEDSLGFCGPLAAMLSEFVLEKRALGYAYTRSTLFRVRELDKHFSGSRGRPPAPDEFWGVPFMALRPTEAPLTTKQRSCLWRQFALFCRRRGMEAWIPDAHSLPLCPRDFCPHIYTRAELRAFFSAVDALPVPSGFPRRSLEYALLFRLLYGAGLRISEALALKIADYDRSSGTFCVRQGKNRKDRLVPLAAGLRERVETYLRDHPSGRDHDYVFASPRHQGRPRSSNAIRRIFCEVLLPKAGIPLRRHGKGPRIHDLRHTFAVHRMENWFLNHEDVEAKLPVLAAYMGHTNIRDTYYYLRITQSFFPEIARRLRDEVGDVIPRVTEGRQ